MEWRLLVRAMTAVTFGVSTAYAIWRVEWIDVFRWGIPSPRALFVYGCYVGVFTTLGWLLAALLTSRRHSN